MPTIKSKPKRAKPSKLLPVSVAVLMGGESKRFGSSKAFLSYKRISMAAHVLGQAARYSDDVFAVSRNIEQVPPDARKDFPVAMDHWKQKGPLSGLRAAFLQARQPTVFLTAVDMPFFNGNVVKGFWKMFEEDQPDVVAPWIGGRWEPLCALWNKELVSRLQPGQWGSFQKLLNEGHLKIRKVREKELKKFDPALDCLRNFNTASEWKKLFPEKIRR